MTVAWPNVHTLGGILLDVDTGGSFRAVTDTTGWKDAPETRPGLQGKAQQDGAWDGTGHSEARVISLEGIVQEATPAAAHTVQQQLAALAPQSVHEFTVVNPAVGSLSALTRVTAGVKTEWKLGGASFRYTLEVTAPDPLKYGPATYATANLATATPGAGRVWPRVWPTDWGVPAGVTPGAVSVANAGMAAYWPRLRIGGPVLNPTVTLVESGAWIRYTGTVLAGQWLDVDMARRRVLLQGQVSMRHKVTSSGDWLKVSPGGGSISWTADTADPAALLSVWAYTGSWI